MTGLTGGFVNYYLIFVAHPQRKEQAPYQAECEDIIRALNMTFDEGCEFKAIWRTAAARMGNGKPGQKEMYDAEKRVHYATASLRAYQQLSTKPVLVEPVERPPLAVVVDSDAPVYEFGTWYELPTAKRPEGLADETIVSLRRNNDEEIGPVMVNMVDWGKYAKMEIDSRAWCAFKVHAIPPTDDHGWHKSNFNRPDWLPKGAKVEVMLMSGDVTAPGDVDKWTWENDNMSSTIVKYRTVY